jgi:hypothetical protein
LRHIEIGNADPANFAFFLQGGEGAPGFFEAGPIVFGRPMDLVEVDDINLQAAQAVFAFLPNGVGIVDFADAAVFLPAHDAFGEDAWACAFPFAQSASDYFFGMTYAVNGGGVNPVDT